jgi:hypothetical protein
MSEDVNKVTSLPDVAGEVKDVELEDGWDTIHSD